MRFKLVLILFFGALFSTLNSVVILVHGSFGINQDWWRPGGDFFSALESQAKKQGHVVVPFCWNGTPNDEEIFKAAEVLVKLIESYLGRDKIILVGHSHGGNVINKATQLLYDRLSDILAEVASSSCTDILSLAKMQLAASNLIPQNPASYLIPAPIPHHYSQTLDFKPTLREKKIYPIERVYLLGTPVCPQRYFPQMGAIAALINLFSEGDRIQTVLGMFDRRYPPHDRIANVSVSFKQGISYQSISPGHSELHDMLIGHWLINIPDMLKGDGVGNFERFSYVHDGHITFDEKSHPLYCLPQA